MSEQAFFNILLVGWFVLAAAIFVALFFIVAPYGRHLRSSWGPKIGDRLGMDYYGSAVANLVCHLLCARH